VHSENDDLLANIKDLANTDKIPLTSFIAIEFSTEATLNFMLLKQKNVVPK
jgi:predicted DNA-binding protein with PD1-like motif